jgi:hypothetical protein
VVEATEYKADVVCMAILSHLEARVAQIKKAHEITGLFSIGAGYT